MEIIGLSGYARSGKDEAAKVLVEEYGFVRVAFADKLREVLYELNPIVDVEYYVHDERFLKRGTQRIRYVREVIDNFGWNGYKETIYGPEIRRLLQRLGTEAGRQTLWDSIWIDAALTGLPEDAKVVVTDCRFPNEAEAIVERGGKMWRVVRDGVSAVNNHPSETSLDDWEFDNYLFNKGNSLEEYRSFVRGLYQTYKDGRNYA